MSDGRLDVGFIPVECPGSTGTGATHTSTLLIEHLSRYHDLTVYISSQRRADPSALPATDRVQYVVHDDLPWLPHPIPKKQEAVAAERDALEDHDLVHSYSSAFIPVLASLDCPVLVTLNSYLAICPKADFRYHGKANCSGPGPTKCLGCVPATSLLRRQGAVAELKSSYFSFGRFPLVRESIAKADEIAQYQALSPHLRDDYVNVGFDADRIAVVPHFYDDRFVVDTDSATEKPRGAARRLLYVGALQDIKGVDVLIDAVAHLAADGHEYTLQIVGSGPMEESLREQASGLGVTDRIVWEGHVEYDTLPAVYRQADLFVYPGLLNEPFGRVMLEAMASKTPIVSSDIGSMETIVGPTGELFETGNSASLAAAIGQVFDHYPRYRSSIEDHLPQFSPESVIGDFVELYQQTARSSS